jgi:hypothetical protein
MTTSVAEVARRLLIRCPTTQEVVPTILRLRPSAFAALQGEHAFRCERCGEIHRWRPEDAWLEQSE